MSKQQQASTSSGKKSKKDRQARAGASANFINYLQTEFIPGEFYDPNYQYGATAAATSGSHVVTTTDQDIFESEALWVNDFGGGMDFDLAGMGSQFAAQVRN